MSRKSHVEIRAIDTTPRRMRFNMIAALNLLPAMKKKRSRRATSQ